MQTTINLIQYNAIKLQVTLKGGICKVWDWVLKHLAAEAAAKINIMVRNYRCSLSLVAVFVERRGFMLTWLKE